MDLKCIVTKWGHTISEKESTCLSYEELSMCVCQQIFMWIKYDSNILSNTLMGISGSQGTTKKGKLLWSLDTSTFLSSIGGNQGFLVHCKLSVSVSHMMLGQIQM